MVWFKNGYIQDEIDGHRALGEPHLVHADRNGNNKIYVLTCQMMRYWQHMEY